MSSKYLVDIFTTSIEHKEGFGEDGNPVAIFDRSKMQGLLCVTDGMGGAGSILLTDTMSEDNQLTGARAAGHAVAKSIREYAENIIFAPVANQDLTELPAGHVDFEAIVAQQLPCQEQANAVIGNDNPSSVKTQVPKNWTVPSNNQYSKISDFSISDVESIIDVSIASCESRYKTAESRLRSRNSYNYPTTIAGINVSISNNSACSHIFWAGDSRCYIWNPGYGLQQLTKDHSKVDLDALDSIRQDSPMSHFINESKPTKLDNFTLTHGVENVVLFTATDGAFDYVESPYQFELIVLEALKASKIQVDKFEKHLRSSLCDIAKDDVTVAGFIIYETAADLEMVVDKRIVELKEQYSKLVLVEERLCAAKEKYEELLYLRDQIEQSEWDRYKFNYENIMFKSEIF